MYTKGLGVEKNMQEAIAILKSGVHRSTESSIQYEYARFCGKLGNMEFFRLECLKYARLAAAQGHKEATALLNEIDPDLMNEDSWMDMSFKITSYLSYKEYEKAIQCCKRGLRFDGKNGLVYNRLRELYVACGKGTDAIQAFQKAIDTNTPIALHALFQIGEIYREGKGDVDIDLQKAIYWYQKTIDSPLKYQGAFSANDPKQMAEKQLKMLQEK